MKGSNIMTNETKNFFVEQVNNLINAPSCCAEAKAAGKEWLEAVGTDKEAEASKKLIAEVERDIMPVDNLIAFVSSPAAQGIFGEEGAKNMLSHANELKAEGANYCDCPACTACAAILEKKDELN